MPSHPRIPNHHAVVLVGAGHVDASSMQSGADAPLLLVIQLVVDCESADLKSGSQSDNQANMTK